MDARQNNDAQVQDLNDDPLTMQQRINTLEAAVANKDTMINRLISMNTTLKNCVRVRDEHVGMMRLIIESKNRTMDLQDDTINKLETLVAAQEKSISEGIEKLRIINEKIATVEGVIAELKSKLAENAQ